MKAGTTESMKFMVLKSKLRMPKYAVVGLLEGLWGLTAASAPDGAIGKFSNLEIAAWLEWEGEADELIGALIDAKFVDVSDDYRLVIHDWADHAPNFIKGNLAKHGKKFAVARESTREPAKEVAKEPAKQGARDAATKSSLVKSSQVKVNTAPQAMQDEYVSKKGRKLTGELLQNFERFWKAFDYRKGRAEAADAWWMLKPKGETVEVIIRAAEYEAKRRRQQLEAGLTPKMAQGWLSGRRWEDETQVPEQKPWYETSSGIEAKAKKLQITKGEDEPWPYFRDRVLKAAEVTV